MGFDDFFRLTRQRIGAITLCLLLGVVGAFALFVKTPAQYTATTSAYVRVASTSNDAGAYYSASQLATQKAEAYVPLFTSTPVAEQVVSELHLGQTPSELASKVSAKLVEDSLTITVTATAEDPGRAQEIANTVIKATGKQVRELEGNDSPVSVVPMASAALGGISKSPSLPRYAGSGALIGVVLGYIIAIIRDRYDTRIRTQQDARDKTGLSVLGVLPQAHAMERTAAGQESDARVSEALRKIRTNLQFANVDSPVRSIVVSSVAPGDGKSSVAAHLACVLANAGQQVLLVDADLRRPTVGRTFNLHGRAGLTQLLRSAVSLDEAVHPTKFPGLSVLPAGGIPPNPSEILGSQRTQELLRFLRGSYFVVVDAPPLLPVTDAAVLSKSVDGVLLVTRAGKTRAEHVVHCAKQINQVGGSVFGIVLNRASKRMLSRLRYGDPEYGYGYGYGSQDYYSTSPREPVDVEGGPVVRPPQPSTSSATPVSSPVATTPSFSAPKTPARVRRVSADAAPIQSTRRGVFPPLKRS